MEGKTKSGFQYKIAASAADDMELLENLVAIDKGDITKVPAAIDAILGEEQKKALYDHLRGEDGRVSVTKVIQELTEIFQNADDDSKK